MTWLARLCPAEAMAGQLDRLVALSTPPAIRFGVIPFDAELPLAPAHGFWLMDQRVVVVETFTGSQSLTRIGDIGSYARIFGELADAARYGPAARSIVTRSLADLAAVSD